MKFSTRLSLFSAIVSAVGLLVVGAAVFFLSRARIERQIIHEQTEIARQVMREIDITLHKVRLDMALIGEDHLLEDILGDALSAYGDAGRNQVLEDELKEMLYLSGPWVMLAVTDRDGRMVASTHPETCVVPG